MKLKLWQLGILIINSLLLWNCNETPVEFAGPKRDSYWPLVKGNSWSYDFYNENGFFTENSSARYEGTMQLKVLDEIKTDENNSQYLMQVTKSGKYTTNRFKDSVSQYSKYITNFSRTYTFQINRSGNFLTSVNDSLNLNHWLKDFDIFSISTDEFNINIPYGYHVWADYMKLSKNRGITEFTYYFASFDYWYQYKYTIK